MEEFAVVSGISRPTVSKYFNDPSSVRASTRTRIENALDTYDFRPNIYAVNQNRKLTKVVGIVVPYLVDPFFVEIAREIERLCDAAGFRPVLLSSHGDRGLENENLQTLRTLRPAGALIAPLGRPSDRDAIRAVCEDIPTVLFDSNIERVGSAFVGSNNDQSVALLVEYLCKTGTPPTFFEQRSPPNPNALKRRAAFRASIARHGHAMHIVQASGKGWDFEEIGYAEGGRILANGGFATSTVLCSNDRLAIGLMAAAYEAGLRVGKGTGCALRIAGHDDHTYARYTSPSLTTVTQDYRAIATRSVETLFALIDAPAAPARRQTVLFEGRLVVRQSA